MVYLDPRKWQTAAINYVHVVNDPAHGRLVRARANLAATFTSTAAFATQLFILIFKNTLWGTLGGALRIVSLETGAPGWEKWKSSANKVFAYAIGIFFSLGATPLSFFTPTPSVHNVRHQFIAGVCTAPDLINGIKKFREVMDKIHLEQLKSELENVPKTAEVHPVTLLELTTRLKEIDDHIAKFLQVKDNIDALGPHLTQWVFYMPSKEASSRRTTLDGLEALMPKFPAALSIYRERRTKVQKWQDDHVETQRVSLSKGLETAKTAVAVENLKTQFKEIQTLLQDGEQVFFHEKLIELENNVQDALRKEQEVLVQEQKALEKKRIDDFEGLILSISQTHQYLSKCLDALKSELTSAYKQRFVEDTYAATDVYNTESLSQIQGCAEKVLMISALMKKLAEYQTHAKDLEHLPQDLGDKITALRKQLVPPSLPVEVIEKLQVVQEHLKGGYDTKALTWQDKDFQIKIDALWAAMEKEKWITIEEPTINNA